MENGEQEYDKLIRPIKMSCWVFGCWPPDDFHDKVKDEDGTLRMIWRRCHHALVFISVVLGFLGPVLEAIRSWGYDMNDTIECILISSAFFVAILRSVIFVIYERDFKFVIHQMRRDWAKSSEQERIYLRKKCLLSFKFCKLFTTNIMIACVAFSAMPLIDMVSFVINTLGV